MAEEKIQRVYTVPLGKAYEYTRTKRARRTINLLRAFLARHMKVHPDFVRISEQVNEFIWARSMQKPPRRVKINVVKENGMVMATLPDEKPKVRKGLFRKAKPAAKTDATEKKPEAKATEKKAEAKPEKKEPKAEKPKKSGETKK